MGTINTRGRTWEVLAEHHEEYQHSTSIMKCGKTLAVSYGAEFRTFAMHEDIAAFREYAMCVRHAIECAGKV